MIPRPPQIRLYDDEAIIDGFAGGGGTSTGIEMALGRSPDVAINHDPVALAMHETNHPETRHIVSNIRHVRYETRGAGRQARRHRVVLAGLHPPLEGARRQAVPRRQKARRIRGLAWEAVRCVKALGARAPRIIIIENVEEWRDWCPLLEERHAGLVQARRELPPVEARVGEGRARRDGTPLRHRGPRTGRLRLRVADEAQAAVRHRAVRRPADRLAGADARARARAALSDGGGVPRLHLAGAVIFLTQRRRMKWAKNGLPKSPPRGGRSRTRRSGGSRAGSPGSSSTSRTLHREVPRARRVPRPGRRGADPDARHVESVRARGAVLRALLHGAGPRAARADARPTNRCRPSSRRERLGSSSLCSRRSWRRSRIPATSACIRGVEEPLRTITCAKGGEFIGLVAPTLINTRNGERHGKHGEQAPRVLDIRQPYPTITALGSQGALVAAFLAKHNGNDTGHDATGQR
jgi:DNA (cytosine-5)-methyltransferase 1